MVSFPVALRKNFQSAPAAASAASPYPPERCGGSAQHILCCQQSLSVTSEKRWHVSKGWRVALPLCIFLKAPLQAGGNKAELGPLHPPPRSTRVPQISSPSAGSGGRGLHPGADSLLCGCTVPEVNCIPWCRRSWL